MSDGVFFVGIPPAAGWLSFIELGQGHLVLHFLSRQRRDVEGCARCGATPVPTHAMLSEGVIIPAHTIPADDTSAGSRSKLFNSTFEPLNP